MLYQVRVVRLDEHIEEEVDIEVAGHLITCFANICPHPLTVGQAYQATLTLWTADGLDVSETQDERVGITKIGDRFRHRVVGILKGTTLNAGVQFDDDLFASEYRYLDGKLVCAEVDRVQIEFQ